MDPSQIGLSRLYGIVIPFHLSASIYPQPQTWSHHVVTRNLPIVGLEILLRSPVTHVHRTLPLWVL